MDPEINPTKDRCLELELPSATAVQLDSAIALYGLDTINLHRRQNGRNLEAELKNVPSLRYPCHTNVVAICSQMGGDHIYGKLERYWMSEHAGRDPRQYGERHLFEFKKPVWDTGLDNEESAAWLEHAHRLVDSLPGIGPILPPI